MTREFVFFSSVVTSQPKSRDYGIISSKGVTRIIGGEVTFSTTEDFLQESETFNRLRKVKLFTILLLLYDLFNINT